VSHGKSSAWRGWQNAGRGAEVGYARLRVPEKGGLHSVGLAVGELPRVVALLWETRGYILAAPAARRRRDRPSADAPGGKLQ